MRESLENLENLIKTKVEKWDDSILEIFLASRQKDFRYASFDYCYNHFYKMEELVDLEKSCAILWSYLSSWGMMRGSTLILKQNYHFLKCVVNYIACSGKKHKEYWEIDFPYSDDDIIILTKIYGDIKNRLNFAPLGEFAQSRGKNNREATNTLITKIMLGVFGTIPAFDNYVAKFFNYFVPRGEGKTAIQNRGVDENTCEIINGIEDIEGFPNLDNLISSGKFDAINFDGEGPKRKYTKAKLIDMYAFTVGQLLKQQETKAVQKAKKMGNSSTES